MLASVFNKSRPVNYLVIGLTLVLFYILYNINTEYTTNYLSVLIKIVGVLLLLIGSIFLVNFITHKNSLSRNNAYAMLLFLVFLILFPTILTNGNVVIANFFILLALRRLISLQSLITPKEKIFDASFWIFTAALFHFWSMLYIILVFISILFHVSRDYRNWLIPFIALFAVAILFTVAALAIDDNYFYYLLNGMDISFDFTYFENIYQNIALAFFAPVIVVFLLSYLAGMGSKPINLQLSHRKIFVAFIIGVAVYVLSDYKNNSFLAFTFAPLAIMGANYLENQSNIWLREGVLAILTLTAISLFTLQLL